MGEGVTHYAEDGTPYAGTYTVVGPPGCGKTTFLGSQVRRILERTHTAWGTLDATPVLVCSLTRTAAQEAVRKCGEMAVALDPKCIGTLHAHAYRSLGCPPVLDGKLIDQWNAENPTYALGMTPADPDDPEWEESDVSGSGPGDEVRELYEVLRSRMVPAEMYPANVVAFAERWADFKKQTGAIDFTDMIELAARDTATAPGEPSVILADEAQDHSKLEFELLRRWASEADAVIMVGDPYQALYTWRGASPEMLLPDAPDPSRFRVLSQSYRVPAAVHKVAMWWIKRLHRYTPIDYRPRVDAAGAAVPGAVSRCEGTANEPWRIIERAVAIADRGGTAMILASCSYLLQKTVSELRGAGIPFANPWRVRRGDWNPLGGGRGTSMADRLMAFLGIDPQTTGTHRLWSWRELYEWTSALKAEGVLVRGGKKAIADRAAESPDIMASFDELAGLFDGDVLSDIWNWVYGREEKPPTTSLAWVTEWYGSRLTAAKEKAAKYPLRILRDRGVKAIQDPPRLYVGTIHSFKGAEADTVFLMPDLSPAGWREWGDETGGGRDGVVRMFYVAMTRARNELVLCDPATTRSVEL